jgi:hypothetical protein
VKLSYSVDPHWQSSKVSEANIVPDGRRRTAYKSNTNPAVRAGLATSDEMRAAKKAQTELNKMDRATRKLAKQQRVVNLEEAPGDVAKIQDIIVAEENAEHRLMRNPKASATRDLPSTFKPPAASLSKKSKVPVHVEDSDEEEDPYDSDEDGNNGEQAEEDEQEQVQEQDEVQDDRGGTEACETLRSKVISLSPAISISSHALVASLAKRFSACQGCPQCAFQEYCSSASYSARG